jgi:hypothetical protein
MTFIQRFANVLWVHGVTAVQQQAEQPVPSRGGAPAHVVRVLQRQFGDQLEDSYFVVTDGLSSKGLGSKARDTFDKVEVYAWVDTFDAALLNDVSLIGCFMHLVATPESPFAYGHSVTLGDGDRLRGYSSFLLSRSHASEVRVGAQRVDVPRVLPLLDDERVTARADVLGGYGFVTKLENEDFAATLARWRGLPSEQA